VTVSLHVRIELVKDFHGFYVLVISVVVRWVWLSASFIYLFCSWNWKALRMHVDLFLY